MNNSNLRPNLARTARWRQRALEASRVLVLGSTLGFMLSAGAATRLADQPLFAANDVPGNLALPLSVEFPTAVSVAHIGNTYAATSRYLGYFDPEKCYVYQYDAVNADQRNSYFVPNGSVTTPGSDRRCNTSATNQWSGNFLNWASTQTIDPFRWALTGGYRYIDIENETVLEKAWASGQGGTGNFPNRTLGNATLTAGATPLGWASFQMRIQGLGNKMRFTTSGDVNTAQTNVQSFGTVAAAAMDNAKVHDVFVRVRVCDGSSGAGPMESNCVAYPSGYSKPEGLMQQYAMKLRYSALGYLNDSAVKRDGGVLRARMKFVGPSEPVPGKPETTNAEREWSATTGVFLQNPDKADADATAAEFGVTVEDSGVLNYLNKFGSLTKGNYKTYDPVGELYYAAIRYFKNQGNVPAWSAKSATTATNKTWVDGFPVITTWDDPIKYSCQKNFILGIGDVNTHADRNLPGSKVRSTNEPAMPGEVSGDATVDSQAATTNVGKREGLAGDIGVTSPYGGCCTNNGALMAGLAFDSHTKDIRPDLPDNGNRFQSISTYWLDVLEYSTYKKNNQFYLAAKYGGFNVPNGFLPYANTDALDLALWSTNGEKLGSLPISNQNDRPDNYFVASSPDTMVAGLTKAFAKLASELQAYTTSFSTSLPQVANSGNKSYSAEYDAKFWTGELKASELSFTGEGEPALLEKWRATDKLAAQLAGTGWDLKRNVASWDPVAKTGVRFRASGTGSLGTVELATLDTTLHATDDRVDFLNYLRGDRKYESGSTATVADPTKKVYRPRDKLLGDIVGSRAVPVAPPNLPMSDSYNPGYAAFKTLKKDRPTLLFAGANDGMLHAFDGTLEGADAGKEFFAYVPSALFSGPDATPAISGLAALGDPNYAHRFYVNASPAVFDVDFAKTDGATGAADWRSILVGGLGKGGRSYYALDVTDAHLLDTEAKVAASVLWEFSNPDLGFSFGEPVMIKTKAYGWTLIIPSGYNNPDGKGYIFLVNPKTGALLEKIGTGVGGGTLGDAGLAHIEAFINDYADGNADAVYGGDLLGNLWRFDIRGSTFPAPQLLAELRDASDKPQPVTSRPLIEVFPKTNIRFVKIGTGQLLSDQDIASAQEQTYYSIRDGNNATFNEAANLPAGVSFPLRRDADLLPNTDLFSGITAEPDAPMGWYFDLGIDSSTSIAWRVVSDSDSFRNAVTFAPTLPNGDACQPSGSSRVYIVDFASGKTLVQDGSTVKAYWSNIAGVVTDLRFLSVGGQARLIGGSDSGEIRKVPGSFGSTLDFRRINWRELPTAN